MASLAGARERLAIPVRRARRIARSQLPVRSRLRLLTPTRAERAVRLGNATVWLTKDPTDIRVFEEVILVREYAGADYRGATVLDIGAHKGYFGAYALLHGAHAVVSVEPGPENLRYLERAAASVPDMVDWRVMRAAVSDWDGHANLQLSSRGWGHRLTYNREESVVRVRIVSMADLLARSEGSRLVVKVDAEGAEDEIVFGTPLGLWERCDSVFVEVHSWARHTHQQVAHRLAQAGLMASADMSGGVVRLRRR